MTRDVTSHFSVFHALGELPCALSSLLAHFSPSGNAGRSALGSVLVNWGLLLLRNWSNEAPEGLKQQNAWLVHLQTICSLNLRLIPEHVHKYRNKCQEISHLGNSGLSKSIPQSHTGIPTNVADVNPQLAHWHESSLPFPWFLKIPPLPPCPNFMGLVAESCQRWLLCTPLHQTWTLNCIYGLKCPAVVSLPQENSHLLTANINESSGQQTL